MKDPLRLFGRIFNCDFWRTFVSNRFLGWYIWSWLLLRLSFGARSCLTERSESTAQRRLGRRRRSGSRTRFGGLLTECARSARPMLRRGVAEGIIPLLRLPFAPRADSFTLLVGPAQVCGEHIEELSRFEAMSGEICGVPRIEGGLEGSLRVSMHDPEWISLDCAVAQAGLCTWYGPTAGPCTS